MRRYNPTYFLATGVKSLWRNGFMTVASIAILVSCLVMMGIFSLLVTNIDYNLENIEELNKIVAFVDVDELIDDEEQSSDTESVTEAEVGTEEETEASVKEQTQTTESDVIVPEIETKPEDETHYELDDASADALFANFESQLDAFSKFADLDRALTGKEALLTSFETLKGKIEALGYNSDELTERFNEDAEKLEYSVFRVEKLYDIMLQIKNISGVDADSVSFTSKSTALAEQKEKYEAYANLYEVLEADDNPFPDTFTITYTSTDGIDLIEWDLEHINGIYSVVCRSDLAQSISSLKKGVVMIFMWLLIILFVVSIFVIVNTIKIAVHARRDEIGVMRYVGATNAFITAPFIIEGGIIGLISAALGFFIICPVYSAVAQRFATSYAMITVIPPTSVNMYLLVGFSAVGIITGILSSAISIRKYLKV